MEDANNWRELLRRLEADVLPRFEPAPQPYDPVPVLDAIVFNEPFNFRYADDVRVAVHAAPLAGGVGIEFAKAMLRGFDEAQPQTVLPRLRLVLPPQTSDECRK